MPSAWNGCALTVVGSLLAAFALAAQDAPASFDDLVRRAEEATGKHPKQAASLYRQALALRPRWVEGWLYLGASLMEEGRYAESRDALQTGTKLDPTRGTAWAYLGLAENKLGDHQQARAHMLKGESLGLADRADFVAAVHYQAALIDLRFSDHAGALEQLRPLVRAGNDSTPIVQALGISALFLTVLPEALSPELSRKVEMAGRAAAAFLAERSEEAAPLFEQLVAQFGSDSGIHYMYGVFLIDRDPLNAGRQFRKELGVTPAHVLSRIQLALLLTKDGQFQEAETFAREAVTLMPSDALCQVTLGRVLLDKGDIRDAIAALRKGEQLAPDAARTHYFLQQAYQRAGRPADAQREKDRFNALRALQEPVTVAGPAKDR